MPDPVDPGSLTGDALTRWYMRSPDEIEQARQQAYAQRHDDFFNQLRSADSEPEFGNGLRRSSADGQAFGGGLDSSTDDVDPAFTWVQVGSNRWKGVRGSTDDVAYPASLQVKAENDGAVLDRSLAGAGDGGELIDVGNPANRRLRREHVAKHGVWPTDPVTGRNYDVAHIVAKADGGTDTLENIRPMHPDDHRAEHMKNGDFARWRARRGGKVVSGVPGGEIPRFKVLGLGFISPLSDLLGMISGRIRTDSLDNFSSDMMGLPSQEDIRREKENIQKQLFPQARPGEMWV